MTTQSVEARGRAAGVAGRAVTALVAGLPWLSIICLSVVLWGMFGVSTLDALVFLAYELGFVLVPGWLAYGLLTGRYGLGLRQLAVAWPFGYALELLAFGVTSAAGVRQLFVLYPVVVGLVALSQVRRVRTLPLFRRSSRSAPNWSWALAALAALMLVANAFEFFRRWPLPWRIARVHYDGDLLFWMALSGEARHHWPLMTPSLAGFRLHYHYFAFMHEAAVNQVTGLNIPLLTLRLAFVPATLILLAQVFVLGRRVGGGSVRVGVVSAALALVVGHVIAPGRFGPVSGLDQPGYVPAQTSPTYVLGAIFFFAAAIELYDLLFARAAESRASRARWLVVLVLFVGAAGSKSAMLPLLGGGLLAVFLLSRGIGARVRRRVLVLGATTVILTAASWVLIFGADRQNTSGRLRFDPGVPAVVNLPGLPHPHAISAVLRVPYSAALIGFSIGKLSLPLLPGILALLWVRRLRLRPPELWLLGMFVTGLVIAHLFTGVGNDNFWFSIASYPPGAVVSALGLRELWLRTARVRTASVNYAVAGGLLLFLLFATVGPKDLLRSFERPPPAEASAPEYVTSELYHGLRWVQSHTPASAVLAVNIHESLGTTMFKDCYYAAFAERRMLLECQTTGGTGDYFATPYPSYAQALENPSSFPFPDRLRLELAIFGHGDRSAVRAAARRYGVRYLLVDLTPTHDGTPAMVERLTRVSHLVFRNSALAVFQVEA